MALLDQLIECYGTEAVISVDPYMPDTSGEILRWVMMIDWKEVPEADIRVSEREGRSVMLLTDGHEQIELAGWRGGTSGPHGEPARFVDTLGALQRRTSRD